MARIVLDTGGSQLNIGSAPNDGTGDPIRTGGSKLKSWASSINSMTSELYDEGSEKTTLDGTEVVVGREAGGTPIHWSVETLRDFMNSANQGDWGWWFEDYIGTSGPAGCASWHVDGGADGLEFVISGPATMIQRWNVGGLGAGTITYPNLTDPIAYTYNGHNIKVLDTGSSSGVNKRAQVTGKAAIAYGGATSGAATIVGSFLSIRAPQTNGDYVDIRSSTQNGEITELNLTTGNWISTPGNRIRLRSAKEWVYSGSFAVMCDPAKTVKAQVGLHAGNKAALDYSGYSLSLEVDVVGGGAYTITPRVYKNGSVVSGFSPITALSNSAANTAMTAVDYEFSNVPTSGNDGLLTLRYRTRTNSATSAWTTVASVASVDWDASPGFNVTPIAYCGNVGSDTTDHALGIDYCYHAYQR